MIQYQVSMHTYKILPMATGLFDQVTVQNITRIIRQGLEEDDKWENFREYLRTRLVQEVGDCFMCGVDVMGKSYFINVFSSGKKNILIGAKYQQMVNLKDIASYAVAKDISEEDIESLGIPRSLHGDVKKYVSCTR